MAAFAAQSAELEGLTGMGALAVRTDGFRRCDGMFHCRLADRDRVVAMLDQVATFRGIVYGERRDLGWRTVPVIVRGFRTQHDGLVLQLRATGDWWRAVEGPPTADIR